MARLFVDLNADLGEEVTDDMALLRVVSSANVACGYHAGTRSIMQAVCAEAVRRGVSLGAQVSYADREGFGRRDRDLPVDLLEQQVADQVGTLRDIAVAEGGQVVYVKPHGALYHRVIHDVGQARALLAGAPGLAVLGFPGAVLLAQAEAAGRSTFQEGFPDRAYTPDGLLASRELPGAVLTDPAQIARRAVVLAQSVDSVCVHGDSPGAVAAALAVRRALEEAGRVLKGL